LHKIGSYLAKNFDGGAAANQIQAYELAQKIKAQMLQTQRAQMELDRAPIVQAQQDEDRQLQIAKEGADRGGLSMPELLDPIKNAMGLQGMRQQKQAEALEGLEAESKIRNTVDLGENQFFGLSGPQDQRVLSAAGNVEEMRARMRESAANRAFQSTEGAANRAATREAAGVRYGQARAPKVSETAALSFFGRAHKAEEDLETLAQDIAKMGVMDRGRLAYTPDWLNFSRSEAMQKYLQAQRAFTEARLRKDSGAAIPESEFENDRRTYFVQPGDTPETIAQKARGRAQVLAGLAYAAGPAFTGFYREEATPLFESLRMRAGGATAAGTETSAVPTLSSDPAKADEEYNALPRGAQFRGTDGKMRRKP
jgi:hypothetical protein